MSIEIVNIRTVDDWIYADLRESGNYVMTIGTEILHVQHTSDLNHEMFKEFRIKALDYLDRNLNLNHTGFEFLENCHHKKPTVKSNIINMWEYRKKPS